MSLKCLFLMRKVSYKNKKLMLADDVIPGVDIADGRGTYVIRKGRHRQRIDEDFGGSALISINTKHSNEALSNVTVNVPSPVYPPSMMTPNSRHSIDLGASPRQQPLSHPLQTAPNVINLPR
jgi:hypothetical protein